MNIIVFRDTSTTPIRVRLSRRQIVGFGVAAVLLVMSVVGGAGYLIGGTYGWEQRTAREDLATLQLILDEQQAFIDQLNENNDRHLNALALQLGEVQSRALRLEALGERLTRIGHLDDGEFDFSQPPALGGPEGGMDHESLGRVDLDAELLQLRHRMERQADQLQILETLIANRELEEGLQPAGRPIAKGWMSSRYGKRADPFTGQADNHPGIDFTGPPNTEILSVAGGVVIWSGIKPDYGMTVDIDHGNGYVTRYAHNKENRVQVGDRVTAGQVIGIMGSTGRSTAPHVHFEVWLEGRRINPYEVVTAGR